MGEMTQDGRIWRTGLGWFRDWPNRLGPSVEPTPAKIVGGISVAKPTNGRPRSIHGKHGKGIVFKDIKDERSPGLRVAL